VHRFNTPLAAGDLREVRGPGAVFFQAGDGVHDFLADQGAVRVVAVAADAGGLGGVREVQAAGAGDPDGGLDDAAVAVVQLDVVRGVLARGLDQVEDGALYAGLVALDDPVTCDRSLSQKVVTSCTESTRVSDVTDGESLLPVRRPEAAYLEPLCRRRDHM
jgi:hypothetical protein